MTVRVDQFKGIAPAISPNKLANGAGVTSTNLRVDAGSLVPEKTSSLIRTLKTGTKSVYRYEVKDSSGNVTEYWLSSTDEISFVESPIIQDTHKRIYMAGGAYPAYSPNAVAFNGYSSSNDVATNPHLPAVQYRLGVPAPNVAPTVVVTGTATGTDVYTSFYVFTFQTAYGEEGPPSAPSTLVTFGNSQTKTVTIPTFQSLANYAVGSGSGARINIYRTATGGSTEFLFVDGIAWGVSTYADTKNDGQLGEVMPSTNWFRPPDDDSSYAPDGPLKKFVAMPGGFFAGFTGKNVCVSEQFLPHAWNPANFLTTESEIVTIQDSIFGLVVLTKTQPYVVTGNSPDSLVLQKLDADQACVSAKSVADLGGEVIYASPDGLISIKGNETRLITEGLITRAQWQTNYAPSTMVGAVSEGRYYGFYTLNNTTYALVYDPLEKDAPFMVLEENATTAHYISTHVSNATDLMYYQKDDNLYSFGTGTTNRTGTWESKDYFSPVDGTYAWGRVLGTFSETAIPRLQIFVIKDGEKTAVVNTDIKDNKAFRLPPKFRVEEDGSSTVSFKLTNITERIDAVMMAGSRVEL